MKNLFYYFKSICKIAIIVSFLFQFQGLSAQDDDSESGIIGGIQSLTISADGYESDTLDGWYVGFYSDTYFSEHWGGQAEFNYTQFDDWWGLQLNSFPKYYFSENFPLNLQVGLQLEYYSSKQVEEMDGEWKFYYGYGVGLDLGRWLLQVRYINELFYGDYQFKQIVGGIGFSF